MDILNNEQIKEIANRIKSKENIEKELETLYNNFLIKFDGNEDLALHYLIKTQHELELV